MTLTDMRKSITVFLLTLALDAGGSQQATLEAVGDVFRNRADVLFIGDLIKPEVLTSLREDLGDELNVYCVHETVSTYEQLRPVIGRIVEERPWAVVVLGVSRDHAVNMRDDGEIEDIIGRIREQGSEIVWVTMPGEEFVLTNDRIRAALIKHGGEVADLAAAFRIRPDNSLKKGERERIVAATISFPLRKVLFKNSARAATLPVTESRDPRMLIEDAAILNDPMSLVEAKGETRTIFRAKEGEWQFNLHSFVAFHAGKFWAIWSTGRIDEDSSSQYICYSTSADGSEWTTPNTLAADPDGEEGPLRWMASGIYVEDGRLFALGTLNKGFGPNGEIWLEARLVRFEWVAGNWVKESVVGEDCAAYFPPLRVHGRDFLIWRDSRAHFFTALSVAGLNEWVVTRLPGPLPLYRMSETSVYADSDGVLHMIIRDQGHTRRLYRSLSYDSGGTWTIPVKTNYPDGTSKNMSGRLSNGWYYLINNPKVHGSNLRDPLAISFSRNGWTFEHPLALRKHAPPLRYPGKAKGSHSFQYSHALEHEGKLWVIYATNKEDIEISAYPLDSFGLN